MKILQSVIFVCVILMGSLVSAQPILEYAFTNQYVSTYDPLTNPTVLFSGTFDDLLSASIAIPEFSIGNQPYTSMKVSSNGFIAFGTYTSSATWTPLSTATTASIIAPMGSDLASLAGVASQVAYQVDGNTVTVEWKNVRRFSSAQESFSFQVVLDIEAGTVYFKYGGGIIAPSVTTLQVGMRVGDDFNSQIVNRSVTTDNNWLTSAAGTTSASSCRMGTTPPATFPEEGLIYVWNGGVTGCMDISACNYDANAEFDNGSCEYCSCNSECGCTDPNACNYDELATVDDGSCYTAITISVGPDITICLGESMLIPGASSVAGLSFSWTPTAGLSNPNILNPIVTPGASTAYTLTAVGGNGCTASNDLMVNVTNCIFGCMLPNACNYNPEATNDDDSCDFSCVGCTDSDALNYNESATIDNGSCYYAGEGNTCSNPIPLSCSDGSTSGMTVGVANDNATSGATACGGPSTGGQRWFVYQAAFNSQVTVSTIGALTNFDTYLKVFTGSCGNLTCVVQNDDVPGTNFQSQCVFTAVAGTAYLIRAGGFVTMQGTFGLTIDCGGGCLDEAACNYNPGAPFDDGSCTFGAACYGCTDPTANNYAPSAVYNEGCQYTPTIRVFHDLNGDGIRQFNEPGLANWAIYVPALGATVFTNASGVAGISLPTGTFDLELVNDNTNWTSTNSSNLSVTVPGSMSVAFGLVPSSGETFFVAGPYDGFWDIIHCSDGYESGVFLNNTGAVDLNGTLTMTCSTLYTPEADAYLTIAPDQVAAGFAQWNINAYTPGSNGLFSFHIDGSGPINLGVTYNFVFHLILHDANGDEIYNQEWTTTPHVACAYDPNDLTASPEGYSDQHFILPGERVQFRVRFQNTGNLPAEDILIVDDLNPQVFDISTFSPMYGSNSYTACLHDDGTIDFIFNDIYLPDIISDEEGSHGFVVYEVSAREDLMPGTVLYNQADIFFDANPAIITNETFHTIFDCTSFTPMIGDMEVCDGEQIELDATQNYVESYAWLLNDEAIVGDSNISLNSLSAGEYDLTLITANPLCEEMHNTTLMVHTNPTVDAGMDISVCDGDAVLLNATSGNVVTWSNGTVNGDSFVPTMDMILTASTTNEFDCSSTDPLNITVNELPSIDVTENGNTLTASSGMSYQWYHNGVAIDNATSQTLMTIGGGEYYVLITSEANCDVISESIMVVSVDNTTRSNIVIYPNPMSNQTTLQLPDGMHHITMYDITGRVVRSYSNCMGTMTIERSGLASGRYQLMIQSKESLLKADLIVE